MSCLLLVPHMFLWSWIANHTFELAFGVDWPLRSDVHGAVCKLSAFNVFWPKLITFFFDLDLAEIFFVKWEYDLGWLWRTYFFASIRCGDFFSFKFFGFTRIDFHVTFNWDLHEKNHSAKHLQKKNGAQIRLALWEKFRI